MSGGTRTRPRRSDAARLSAGERIFRFAWLPPVVLAVVTIGLVWLQPQGIFEPPWLLLTLNTVLMTVLPLIGVVLAATAYRASGLISVLAIGAALLALAATGTLPAVLLQTHGPNAAVTMHNSLFMLSAVCQFLAALTAVGVIPLQARGPRAVYLGIAYGAVVACGITVLALILTHRMPTFFIQSEGPTVLRQVVLAVALCLFGIAAVFWWQAYVRVRLPFIRWYYLALVLFCLATIPLQLQASVGSALTWEGRFAQYLAVPYVLIAVLGVRASAGSGGFEHRFVASLLQATLPYRPLLDSATEAIVALDDRGAVLYWNDAATRMFGIAAEDSLGADFAGLVADGPAQQELRDGLAAHVGGPGGAGRDGNPLLTSAFTAQGRRFPIQAAFYRNQTGGRALTICVVRDITDRLEAEAQLGEVERRYRLLAENASDVVWERRADGAIVWASPSVEAVLGWKPAELIGTFPADVVHPDDLPRVNASMAGIVTNAAPLHALEGRFRTVDGRYLWMSVQARPVHGPDGSVTGTLAGLRDINDQVLARMRIAESEQLLRVSMDGAPQGMAVVGLELRFLRVNAALVQLLNRDAEWLLDNTVSDVVHVDDQEADRAGRERLLAGESDREVAERRWVKADGSQLWVMHSTSLVRDDEGKPLFFVSHIQDNSDAHRIREELASRANRDPLTGLINRELLQGHLAALLTAPRQPGVEPAVLFCDLDNFKPINDTYGHSVGDEVLLVTARRIAAKLGKSDLVARVGGDEFVIVLGAIPEADSAREVAEQIRRAIAEPLSIGDGRAVTVRASIGIVLATPRADAHRLLRNADAALYEAKRSGRDQIAVFQEESNLTAAGKIRAGLAAAQFAPWFQPMVNLHDGALVGYEALARWVKADGRVIEPGGFLPDAERTTLITDLDQAILEQAVRHLATLAAPLHIAVNVSAATIARVAYGDRVIELLDRYQVDPLRLRLEFTETAMFDVTDQVRRTMQDLADVGIRWYVDDFGTGYSSISHLRDLPVAGLKLDRSFTAGLESDDVTCVNLAQALAGLAAGLGLDTVAEGIESEKQADVLTALGWKHGQGWLYGRPAPPPVAA